MGLGLPSGSGAEWAAGLGTPVAGCQLPLFWDLERMPWKGGGVASMGIRRPSCLWEPEKGRGCSQLLLCLVCRPELAGAASLPSFNGCCICSDLSPGGGCGTLFLPIADGAAGPRSQVLAGRVGRGPCPAPCMDLCQGPSGLRQPLVSASRWGQEVSEAGASGAAFRVPVV